MSWQLTLSSLLFLCIHTYITVAEYECTQPDTYIELPPLPNNVGEVASAIIDNNLYLVGQVNEETYKYSLTDATWSTVSDRLYKGNHHGSIVFNNEWWLIGGIDAESYDKIQIYNPISNQWREKPSLPWESGSPCVALIDDIIYICGGITTFKTKRGKLIPSGKTTVDTCAKYNPKSDTAWQMISSMPYGRNHAAVTSDNQRRMWIFGGRIGKNTRGNGYDTVQVFDTISSKWITSDDEDEDEQSNLKSMPFPRGGMGHAIFYEGKMYIFGGESLDNPKGFANENMTYDVVNIYDMERNEWSTAAQMLHARHGIFPVLYENAVYMAGGGPHNGFSSSNKFTKYCLKADGSESKWIQVADMATYASDDTSEASILMYVVLLIMIVGAFIVYRKWNRNQNKLVKVKLGRDIERKLENKPFLSERNVGF